MKHEVCSQAVTIPSFFGKSHVRISAQLPEILTEACRGFISNSLGICTTPTIKIININIIYVHDVTNMLADK
jgi:hypothetical protein